MLLFDSFFGEKKEKTSQMKNALDLVTYTAGLVSNPEALNTALDKVRSITARLVPGQTPGATDEKRLLAVYLQIETYLTTKEPLRSFTKDELRKHADNSLLSELTSYEAGRK